MCTLYSVSHFERRQVDCVAFGERILVIFSDKKLFQLQNVHNLKDKLSVLWYQNVSWASKAYKLSLFFINSGVKIDVIIEHIFASIYCLTELPTDSTLVGREFARLLDSG
jgi:hypothetical protein